MQFLYDKQVVVKRYSSTLGEFNRPNKTLVEVVTYECHTAEDSTTTAQLQPQKKNTTDLTLYTDPEAPIKRGDILYIYELYEYDKRFLPADKLSVGGKAKYLKNRNQKGIMLKESYVNGSFFMEKGMQDAKPRLNRLVESFLQQIGREIEGGSL